MRKMMTKYTIATIPGDGIGKEVTAEAVKVLQAIEAASSLDFEFINIEGGGQYYQETGKEWEDGSYEICRDDADAILLGAVGWPGSRLPDGGLAGAGIVFGLRFGLDLYANVRPTKLYPGVLHTVHGERKQVWEPGKVDLVTVRENTEGLYAPIRGILDRGEVEEVGIDTRIITKKGSERVIKYAFELAMRRSGAPQDQKKRVTCVDKSNVLKGDQMYRRIYDRIAEGYPDIEKDYAYIDAYLQWLVRNPDFYDVIVTSNMFGDISSDLAAVLGGSLGMAASGNIGDNHGLFEPVHGSAPKHAGKNRTNPIATVISAGMMLDFLGVKHKDDEALRMNTIIDESVSALLKEGSTLTYDLGGNSSTSQVGDALSSLVTQTLE
jgi:3-isopropylmalate dehydrogenase